MKIALLCPTYLRPGLVPTAIAQALAQEHTHEVRLFILDDAQQYDGQRGDGWQLTVAARRFATMGAKHNALVRLAMEWGAQACCLWDDDDVYLRRHVAYHAEQLALKAWSIPRAKWMQSGADLTLVHHDDPYCQGSWAFRVAAWEAIGGYPEQPNNAFDFDLASRLIERFGPPGDYTAEHPPQFVYRWFSTGYRNVSSFGGGEDGRQYYYDLGANNGDAMPQHGRLLVPQLDEGAAQLHRLLPELRLERRAEP